MKLSLVPFFCCLQATLLWKLNLPFESAPIIDGVVHARSMNARAKHTKRRGELWLFGDCRRHKESRHVSNLNSPEIMANITIISPWSNFIASRSFPPGARRRRSFFFGSVNHSAYPSLSSLAEHWKRVSRRTLFLRVGRSERRPSRNRSLFHSIHSLNFTALLLLVFFCHQKYISIHCFFPQAFAALERMKNLLRFLFSPLILSHSFAHTSFSHVCGWFSIFLLSVIFFC